MGEKKKRRKKGKGRRGKGGKENEEEDQIVEFTNEICYLSIKFIDDHFMTD